MATESIFRSMVIDDPEMADLFLTRLLEQEEKNLHADIKDLIPKEDNKTLKRKDIRRVLGPLFDKK